jgi:hypothetical protein
MKVMVCGDSPKVYSLTILLSQFTQDVLTTLARIATTITQPSRIEVGVCVRLSIYQTTMTSWSPSRLRVSIGADLVVIITWLITVVVITSTIVSLVRILSDYQTPDGGMVKGIAMGVQMPTSTPVMIAVMNTGTNTTIASMTQMRMITMESSIVIRTDHDLSSLALVSII